jgi:hypothetical protein
MRAFSLAIVAGSAACAPALAQSFTEADLRDTRADFGRAELAVTPGAAFERAAGGVDPTIGNPNPWRACATRCGSRRPRSR